MINPKELRIGCYFLNPSGTIEQCFGVLDNEQGQLINPMFDYSTESIGGYNPNECGGMPLTPELLTRCGFIQRENRNDYMHPTKLRICLWGDDIWRPYIQLDPYSTDMPETQYLHQLMNLFYCLTGTELTITL